MILQCYVDDKTAAVLKRYAMESHREVEELAEAAIAEAAIDTARTRGWLKSNGELELWVP